MHYNIDNPDDVRDLDSIMPEWIAAGNPKANAWLPLPPKPSEGATWQNGQWVEPSQAELAAAERAAQRTALRQQWDALPDFIRGPFRDKFQAANRLLDEGDDDAAIALIVYADAPASFTGEQLATFAATQAAMKAGIEGLTQAY